VVGDRLDHPRGVDTVMTDDLTSLAAELRAMAADASRLAAEQSRAAADVLAGAVRAAPGHPSYRAVYRRLATGVRTRPDPDGARVVVTGGRAFSGGATIDQLAPPYEYGSPRGDARRGRHPGARRGSQFPPATGTGYWVEATTDREGPRIQTEWSDALADEIGRGW
jgi:hypothetical protein